MRGEKVHTVADLLAKYKKIQAPQGAVTEVFVRAVFEVVGVEIPITKLTYNPQARTMYTTLGGPLKQELRLKSAQILRVCARELGATSAPKTLV